MSSTENIQDPVTYANEVAASVDDNLLAVDNSSSSSSSFEPSTLEEVYSQVFPSNNLVFARRPTDRRTRKQKNAEFANLLRSNVPSFAGADDAQIRAALAMAAANVNKPQRTVNTARRNALKAAGLIAPPNPQLVQARQRLATALKDNTIRDPNLERFLGDVNVRGATYDPRLEVYSRLRDENKQPIFTQSWKQATPQQLPAAERLKAARLFAEMNGMLGWQPKYDRRFLTTASAAQALDDPDMQKYQYNLYDMDDNLYTPGTLIVSDKDGNIVSVGGYVMGDATPQQTHSYLKDMLYYGKHPTVNSRRMQPKGQFLQSVGINKRNVSKGLAPIKNAIETILTQLFKIEPPQKILNNNGRVIERPALIGLYAKDKIVTNGPDNVQTVTYGPARWQAVYSLSSIAYNTVLSNITNLYMNLFYYHYLNLEGAGLGALRGLFPQRAVLNPNADNLQQLVYGTWVNSFVDGRITALILRDPFINRQVNEHASKFVQRGTFDPNAVAALMKVIPCLLNVVMTAMMNTHITSELKSKLTLNERRQALKNFQEGEPKFVFGCKELPPENHHIFSVTYTDLASMVAGGTPTMASTPIAWKTVKEMFGILERGGQYIEGDNALTRDQLYQNFLPTQ